MLEDGAFVKPVLEFFDDGLDLERQDPQGRTLFLAACRNPLGLDAGIDGRYDGLMWGEGGGISHNPFPQRNNPWRPFERERSTRTDGPTFLHYFVSRGANLHAVDNYGRNALHNMLDAVMLGESIRPLIMTESLIYLTTECRSLINQSDYAGFFPLHIALRRMTTSWLTDNQIPEALLSFDGPLF